MQSGRAAPTVHLVVDAANVVGSRPDGWWRDRAGAAARLAAELVAALATDRAALVALAGPAAESRHAAAGHTEPGSAGPPGSAATSPTPRHADVRHADGSPRRQRHADAGPGGARHAAAEHADAEPAAPPSSPAPRHAEAQHAESGLQRPRHADPEPAEARHADTRHADADLTVHLVLEGAAKSAVVPVDPALRVVLAPADGDSAIAELAAHLSGTPVVVVTADQGLRKRVQRVGATVVGPRVLRAVLER